MEIQTTRKIIHLDMDYFFAAVELRAKPELRDKPVAIGSPKARGVVATCNYVAREFGVHSAMSSIQAQRLCPQLIFLPPDFEEYRRVSRQIRAIMRSYTPLVEPLSLDEAYLDLTACRLHNNVATAIASSLKKKIYAQTGLTSSAGISVNKFLAKIASDWQKPDGLTVIPPSKITSFVRHLPVEKIPGVGKVTARKLRQLGIKTCADLQQWDANVLLNRFGKFGAVLLERAFGRDDRPVQPRIIRKSLSVERTYMQDLRTAREFEEAINTLFTELMQRLDKAGDSRPLHGIFIKVKYADFIITTKQATNVPCSAGEFQRVFAALYQSRPKPVRLLGLGVVFTQIAQTPTNQLPLNMRASHFSIK